MEVEKNEKVLSFLILTHKKGGSAIGKSLIFDFKMSDFSKIVNA